ncbi:hypothetical protein CK203_114514 [Vitis vinifera]|uniref:Ubiquitin-like protease family profile domain-containing protein n=1 Tax=Vitis vinifera TaxID=29760 RepID=A0A438FDL8_VITVI|nr:hypothetical protein CK203_114514 [Vitis vinifera]
MHDTSLTRGNLASFQGDSWIGNDVVDAFCRMLQFDDESRTKLFLSPYIADMVIRSNAKYLTHDAIVARFDPYMYAFDGSYQHVTQAKVVLMLVADKKEMVAVDLNMYSFVMPDVPCQPNDNDCGVFIMKFMDNWSNGGLSKSIDVLSRSGIDWVYDWGNKSGRPVTKPSTSIRPGNDRSMVYTRPGSHHPQPVTYSHWERENVKNSSDRYSTGYRPVDHGTNQPLGERECRNCTRPVPRPMIDLQSTGRYDYSTGHTQLLGERENEMLSCDRGRPVEDGRSTGRFTYRACLRPVEHMLTLFLL